MFIRNSDTGKWSIQTDTLSKDNYDSLKQDLDKVRLYSKCLSGSTYIPINSLTNIYDALDISKLGFYINQASSQINVPQSGPTLPLNSSNSSDFYNKYLEEYAFSIKNSFTPNVLIQDQLNNFLEVDVATTLPLTNIGQTVFNLTIDGIILKEGHRLLVKDQVSEINLSSSVNADNYFTNIEPVATYSILSNNITNIQYQWYNEDNGIYVYTNNKLVKTNDLDTYLKSYKYSVNVKLGNTNREKQFHLSRLKNGYYPVGSENQNLYFVEKNNWILRHRVDYNNIFDINYYDIIDHGSQSIFIDTDSRTYSIPPRTIAVGEFGVIIDNQDLLIASATHSQSHLITNKYKINLRSICEVDKYYWICGDEGNLLRVSKVDFSIKKIELDETSNLMSVSFFGNLNGMVVGKFNSIYYTQDGGDNWYKITNPEFDLYSYNKVVHYDFNQAYIGGETGVFIELLFSSGNWLAYKRKIAKQLNSIDEYMLVEDINDMSKTSWTKIVSSTHSEDQSLIDFSQNLLFINTSGNYYELVINLESRYFGNPTFSTSTFLGAVNIQDSDGNTIYNNSLYNNAIDLGQLQSYDFYQQSSNTIKTIATFSLPIDIEGNLSNKTFNINIDLAYNYDALSDTVIIGYNLSSISYNVKTIKGKMLLIGANNDNIINYDIDSILTPIDNQFIYFTSTQSHSDIKTISRRPTSQQVYIGGDKIYNLQFSNFTNFGSTISNIAQGNSSLLESLYINKLFTSDNNLYLCGNNSLLRFSDYNSNSNELDPTFFDDLKSKLLFLDYDVASKLNFFTDDGEYRLASSITFSTSSLAFQNSYVYISNLTNEYNWLNYYKDAEKTFRYYSDINDANKIEFSTTFSSTKIQNIFTFSGPEISINSSDILPIAPNILSNTQSKFISDLSNPITSNFDCNFKLLMQRELLVIKVNQSNNLFAEEGDVLRLSSNIVDCNLVINRIERYLKDTGTPLTPGVRILVWPTPLTSTQYVESYLYCYSNFNDNIIRNLKNTSSIVTVTNLNKFNSINQFAEYFEYHPTSIGFKLEISNNIATLSQRFNNNTAYYNMQSKVMTNNSSLEMKYLDSFLNFGYSPQYNILDYLSKIDSNLFTSSSIFTIMPEYYNLPGNNGNTFTQSNIYIDLSEGPQTGTYSWYRNGTNKVIFGSNFKFHWESLLIYTFIDLQLTSTTYGTALNSQMLITKKYYDASVDGYVIEFNKKIITPNANNFDVASFDFLSRNTLEEISLDLQILNNIQRTQSTKSIQYLNQFTSLQNALFEKFYTDSYCKILASDYRIRESLSGLVYVDNDYQLAMNIFNVDKVLLYEISGTDVASISGFSNKLQIYINGQHEMKEGDLIYAEFIGGSGSSQELNPQYFGYQTVIYSLSTPQNSYIITSLEFGQPSQAQDIGRVTFRKKDSFFNYQAIDIFDLGVDKNVTKSVEVLPENIEISENQYNLKNLDLTNYKMRFVDGLSLEEVNSKYGWLLEAEISNAIIGKDKNGLVWYSGIWKCGRWFGGTWYSGSWISGDWYDGVWNAFNTKYNVISVQIDNSYIDDSVSKWFNGRWFGGTWNGGTWYNGRRYSGDWNGGFWYNGIWNDGNWKKGLFEGGVWVLGNWESGVFNCNSKPAYWLDGQFRSGDFENGIWYNGQFGNERQVSSRFGTKSTNSRTSTWHGGRWINGEFHSYLNVDSETNLPVISDIHKYSIWRTGTWLKGDFYGGIAFNINFRSGIWHGGILEEIQVIGVDPILPATTSSNSITLNGIFKFNIGDEIWLIDDDRNGAFSPLGSNNIPRKYRINEIEEFESIKQTKVYLNYDLSSLNVNSTIATQSYINVETGERVVSYFKDSTWNSGIWTNGIFVGGQFNSGIWYNGVFEGTWGN